MATPACLDENDAIRIVLDPADPAGVSARAHVDGCEPCRELVAAVAKLVVDDDSLGDGVPWDDDALRPGARVGAYRVESKIGAGAMGTVYLARDDRLRRRIALKLLGPELSGGAALRRLRAEAQSMARLRHPHVVEVLDVGTDPPFVAMQYVDGPDLRAWLAERTRPFAVVLDVLRQAGEGLAAAHAAGLVHRDFKPANVLVGRDGRVRVADFGLAVLRGPDDDETTPPTIRPRAVTTTSAAIAGTPAYMAPEQLGTGRVVGPAADQFAFCVTAFEAWAGHRPFPEGDPDERRDAIEAGRLRPAARPIPRHVLAVLRRGLRPDPSARFEDMPALLDALRPRRRVARRWVLPGLTLGAIALGALAVAADRDGPCARSSDTGWSQHDRASLRSSWWAQGVADPTTDRLIATLDRHTDGWTVARAEACADPAAPNLERLSCLDQLRDEVEAFAAEAIATSPQHAEGFVRAAGKLRRPRDCKDVSSGRLATADPKLAAEATELRSAYLSAMARSSAVDRLHLRPRVLETIARAKEAGDVYVQAELTQWLGVIDTGRADYPSASDAFERAYLMARGAGFDQLAFDSALSRTVLAGSIRHDLDDAWRWVRHARAHVAAVGPAADVQLLVHEADLHMLASAHEDAMAKVRRAEARLAETDDLPEHVPVSLYGTLGQLLAFADDDPGCREAFGRAIAHVEQHMGVEHVDLVRPLIGIATCEMEPGRYDDAQRHLERAVELAQRAQQPMMEGMARGNLGLMFRNLERPTAALHQLARADALMREIYPETHFELARSACNVADAEYQTGHYADALAHSRQGRETALAQPFDPGSVVYGCDLVEAWSRQGLGTPDLSPRFEDLVAQAPTDNYRACATTGLVEALVAEGRHADAVQAGADLFADDAPFPAMSDLRYAEGRMYYALALRETGEDVEATRQLARALEIAEPLVDDDPRRVVPRIRAAMK